MCYLGGQEKRAEEGWFRKRFEYRCSCLFMMCSLSSGGLLPLKDEIFYYVSDFLKLSLGLYSSQESAIDS